MSAVAWGLGIGEAPHLLPDNALELYIKAYPGRLRETSMASYRSALDQWARYQARGHLSLERVPLSSVRLDLDEPADVEQLHPTLRKWRRTMRTEFKAKTTVTGYLKIVLGMLEEAGKDDPLSLDEEDVQEYIDRRIIERERIGKELSVSRHDVYLAAVRCLFRDSKRKKDDPTADLKRLRRRGDGVRTPVASTLTVRKAHGAAVEDMASTDATRFETGRRMWLLTALMSGMGYRISSATRTFPRDDLDFDGENYWLTPQFLKARKGRPIRQHPVPEHIAHEILSNWSPGESLVPLGWTVANTADRWSAWMLSKGLTSRPHQFRAYWIDELIELTGDLESVSLAADHRDVQTTIGYRNRRVRRESLTTMRRFHTDMPARVPAQRTEGTLDLSNVRVLGLPAPA
ncbi:phage integrase N-terminal SAM-like domain-containing protein [Streptomyces sp. NPDC059247]|uniref:phage integrase N-terminal SAM-like domain-containing protein n=1 Tax=Streptomyces sp. NPDC059247 TaxID=3346790 RepID=UPI003678C98A